MNLSTSGGLVKERSGVARSEDGSSRVSKRALAFAVSLFSPGLGHFLYGRFGRGILWVAIAKACTITVPVTAVAGVFGALLAGPGSAIDVLRVADRRVGWKVVTIALAGLFLFHLVTREAMRAYVVRPYRLSSSSMSPTLLSGDWLMANRFAYRTGAPRRGDLVVFRSPVNPSVDFVHRCVAVEGQTVEIRGKVLYVDGRRQQEPFARHYDPTMIPGGTSPRDSFGPAVVPVDCIFVMGDNRDNSYDSRFWGPLPVRQVRGRADFLYWSWDSEHNRPRLERVGRSLLVHERKRTHVEVRHSGDVAIVSPCPFR